MSIQLNLATSPEDREAVFRLRYEVYISEMHVRQEHADHARRTIEEPLDYRADLIAAFIDGTVIGTARLNYAADGVGEYASLYGMEHFKPDFPHRTCTVTKLMVSSQVRGTAVALAICKKAYSTALGLGMRFCFIDCSSALLPLFQRLGFRIHLSPFAHPATGEMHHRLVLDLEDRAHLDSCRSPFLAILCKHRASAQPVRHAVLAA